MIQKPRNNEALFFFATVRVKLFCILAEADAAPGGDAAPGAPGGRKLSAHEEILALRKRLPVFKYREEFLEAVRDHQVGKN